MGKILSLFVGMFETGTLTPKPSPAEEHVEIKIPRDRFSPPLSPADEIIVLRLKPDDAIHLRKLSQYFECPYEGLIARGLWLMDLFRSSDLQSKKLCIVEVEPESGEIMTISPITLN